MNAFLKEYGTFLLATISIIILTFTITFVRTEIFSMSQHLIANLTGVDMQDIERVEHTFD